MQITEMVLPQSVDCVELRDIPFKVLKTIKGNLVWAGEADVEGGNGAEHVAISEEEIVLFDSEKTCIQRIELADVSSITGSQHNVVITYRNQSYIVTPVKESITLLLQTLLRVYKTSEYIADHGIQNFPADKVPDNLSSALSILYNKGTPQILWLGWISRRDDSTDLVYSKKTLIITDTAMYIGNIEDSGNKITRCISFDKIKCVIRNGTELLFRIPLEYDIILKEDTVGLIMIFEAMFRPIHVSKRQLRGRLVKSSGFTFPPLIPIKVSQVEQSRTETILQTLPVSPYSPILKSEIPINIRHQFSSYKSPTILWVGNILRQNGITGVSTVAILTPLQLYIVDALDITNVFHIIPVCEIQKVSIYKKIWCSIQTVDGNNLLFHTLDPPSELKAKSFLSACAQLSDIEGGEILINCDSDCNSIPDIPSDSLDSKAVDVTLDLMCAGHASVCSERERNDNSSLSVGSLQDSVSGVSVEPVRKQKNIPPALINPSDLRIMLSGTPDTPADNSLRVCDEYHKKNYGLPSPKSPSNLGIRHPSHKSSPQQLSSSASDLLEVPISFQRSNSQRSNHDADTGLPFVSYSQLNTAVREFFHPLYKQGNPEIVWANILLCCNKKRTYRSLVVTPRAVYLGAKTALVRCVPVALIKYVAVEKLKIAIKIPSQFDLLLEASEEGTIRSLICLLCAVVKGTTGELLGVKYVDKLDMSQWVLTRPPGLPPAETIPIAVY